MHKSVVPAWFEAYVTPDLLTSELLKFKIYIPSVNAERREVVIDVPAFLDLDDDRLELQIPNMPSELAYLGMLYSTAKYNIGLIERSIKIRRGQCTKEVLDSANIKGCKLTDNQLKSIVDADEELAALEGKLLKANEQVGKLYHLHNAVEKKIELARSMFARKRQEFNT